MDPTTTLITFMLQTAPNTRTVKLVGSWDNFTTRYQMEKDLKRGSGEWRGCYSFKDIICDGDEANGSKRNGGLKMGETYYYYYEVDDGTEVHNAKLPFTTVCQYLPGQPVNLLFVPIEKATTRQRSASVGAPCVDFKTMNPADKYLAPRAAPPVPKAPPRLGTSAGLLRKRESRSASPARSRSPWSKRALFGRRSPSPADRRRLASPLHSSQGDVGISPPVLVSSSIHTHSAEFSSRMPLREFSPCSSRSSSAQSNERPTTSMGHRPTLLSPRISEEIVEEEREDDDFALLSDEDIEPEVAVVTYLSPPPAKQHLVELPTLSRLPALQLETASSATVPAPLHIGLLMQEKPARPQRPEPKSHFSLDTIASSMLSPVDSQFDTSPSMSECNDDATDESFFGHSVSESPAPNTDRGLESNPFVGYSLPLDSDEDRMKTSSGKLTPAANIIANPFDSRQTFGFHHAAENDVTLPNHSNLDQLLVEMGYLGEMIIED